MVDDAIHTAGADRYEPRDHHRPEQTPNGGRAVALHREQRNDDHRGDRHDPAFQLRLDDLDALDRGQHRDRGGDHAVAEEQRGAEEAQRGQRHDGATTLRASAPTPQQRDERHDAALAVVVGAHHQGHVGQRDDDHHRPENQRHDAVHIVRADRHGVRVVGVEDGLDGVDRAGADVAEHDTECADHNGQANRFCAADCARRRRRFGICVHGEGPRFVVRNLVVPSPDAVWAVATRRIDRNPLATHSDSAAGQRRLPSTHDRSGGVVVTNTGRAVRVRTVRSISSSLKGGRR